MSDRGLELRSAYRPEWGGLIHHRRVRAIFADKQTVLALAITSGVTLVPAAGGGAVVAIVSAADGICLLVVARPDVRGTTLVAAWWWTLAALVAWSCVEAAAGWLVEGLGAAGLSATRLAAISLSLCPAVALVGAKRPQHSAWNFVVLALWCIVALPAAEALFLGGGRSPEMGGARGWFLWLLVLLVPINFVPTRYWAAALLASAGQVVALGRFLPLVNPWQLPRQELIGLAVCVVALLAAWTSHRLAARPAANRYDRLWLDFRDSFGMLWGLRVQERVNAIARQLGWDLELAWSGFRRPSDGSAITEIDPAIEPALRTSLKGLLRRFVSGNWIAERLKRPLD